MGEIAVDIIGLKTFQAGFATLDDLVNGFPLVGDGGGEDHGVLASPQEGLAQQLFGVVVAFRGGHEIAAPLEQFIDDVAELFAVVVEEEGPELLRFQPAGTTQSDGRDLQIGAAEAAIGHVGLRLIGQHGSRGTAEHHARGHRRAFLQKPASADRRTVWLRHGNAPSPWDVNRPHHGIVPRGRGESS